MATATRKGGNARGKAKTVGPRRKVRQISVIDRLLRTLPFSEDEIQRVFNWLVIGALTLAAIFAAQYFGIATAAYQQYAQAAAKAGFEVQRVEITGMERVDQLKIYNIVLAEKDRAMPLVDIEKIRTDLARYGWIKDVRVSRRLPDTLVVQITERKPTAVWQREGKMSLIDADGIVLENIKGNEVGNLPMLHGTDANRQAVALNVLLDNATSLKPQVTEAKWIGNRRWDLTFKSGETLALPEGEKAAAEALVNFARMDGINRLLGRDMIYFDLRDPARMYLRKTPKPEPVEVEQKTTATKSSKEA